MPGETRRDLVRRAFNDTTPGTALTAEAVMKRLVDLGHDFGVAGISDDVRTKQTEQAIRRLVTCGELVDGPRRGSRPTFARPSTKPVPSRRQNDATTTSDDTPQAPTGVGIESVAVFIGSYAVGLTVLFILIALFEVF